MNGFIKKRLICRKCVNEVSKLYKKNNKERIFAYDKEYKLIHVDEISEYNARYDKENRTEIQARQTIYQKERRKTDPEFKMAGVLRKRLGSIMKEIGGKKSAKTLELLGCSLNFFKEWLEFRFNSNMTFENHGSYWHVDHVKPCASYDLIDEEDQKECFNWKNLQPLYWKENDSKNDKIIIEDIDNQMDKVDEFLEMKKSQQQKAS
jgi:hypothetical protein